MTIAMRPRAPVYNGEICEDKHWRGSWRRGRKDGAAHSKVQHYASIAEGPRRPPGAAGYENGGAGCNGHGGRSIFIWQLDRAREYDDGLAGLLIGLTES